MDKKRMEFISLCIETFKIKYKKSGQNVLELFDDYGVTEFLEEGYDMLHSQSIQYTMEEIDMYLRNRGYTQR